MHILHPNKQSTILQVALTGMMAAVVLVSTMFLHIDIPLPTGKTMLSLGNAMCLLSGLLLGPIYGGLAGGLGSFLYDLMDPVFISQAPITFLFKFAIGFVSGMILYAGKKERPVTISRSIVGGIAASLTYMLLYLGKSLLMLVLAGSELQPALVAIVPKIAASSSNAILAVLVAVPLSMGIRTALQRAHLVSKARG